MRQKQLHAVTYNHFFCVENLKSNAVNKEILKCTTKFVMQTTKNKLAFFLRHFFSFFFNSFDELKKLINDANIIRQKQKRKLNKFCYIETHKKY